MISIILSWLASLILSIISNIGYAGIFFLTALESACIPIPSEIIMPFSGFLVSSGRFILWQVVVLATFGELAGSAVAYAVGFYGGRPLVKKYGRHIFISSRDLETADEWFSKYGQIAVFFSRLLPVVRTFISLPAGIAKMDFKKFCFYTFVGSLIWVYILTWAGVIMGENWQRLKIYFEKFDIIIVAAIVVVAAWWIRRHLNLRHNNG